MKRHILTAALVFISLMSIAQRKIPMATRYCPKMENQITKEDSLSDEFGLEYTEREFRGAEEDTASLNKDFREREALKKGKITDPEREIVTFDYEKIFYTDMRDFKKAEAEYKKEKAINPKK